MIVILASEIDVDARKLADDFSEQAAVVLTPADLCTPGWKLTFHNPESDWIVAGGRPIRCTEIKGVLTLLPAVSPRELVHLVGADREYAASEMTALLTYWLSGLACPMLNRPTAACLSGPAWRANHWRKAASECGLPVADHLGISDCAKRDGRIAHVTVVGNRTIARGNRFLGAGVRALAQAAGVECLEATFDMSEEVPRLLSGSTFPRLSSSAVRRAVVNHFAFEKVP